MYKQKHRITQFKYSYPKETFPCTNFRNGCKFIGTTKDETVYHESNVCALFYCRHDRANCHLRGKRNVVLEHQLVCLHRKIGCDLCKVWVHYTHFTNHTNAHKELHDCQNKKQGCEHQCEDYKMTQHLGECTFFICKQSENCSFIGSTVALGKHFHCQNSNDGCIFFGTSQETTAHQQVCSHRIMTCHMCSWRIRANVMNTHIETCQDECDECDRCKYDVVHKELQHHLDNECDANIKKKIDQVESLLGPYILDDLFDHKNLHPCNDVYKDDTLDRIQEILKKAVKMYIKSNENDSDSDSD
jgi:hypothetical protein